MDRKQISETGSTERPEASGEPEGERKKVKRIDVSVPQVAGSALAAVIAAVVAGQLGVYGTFVGAGVVSVVATTGAPMFQHLFHRTGEQVKEVKGVKGLKGARTSALPATNAAEPGDTDRTQLLPQAAPEAGEFGAATTQGTRWRGWRRTLLPAVLVFAVAIGGLTLYEAVSGTNVSGGHAGTSIGDVFHQSSAADDSPSAPEQSTDGDDRDDPDSTGGTGGTGDDRTGGGQQAPSADPAPDQGGSGDQHGGTGTGTDSGSGGSTPTPTPSPDGSDGGESGGDGGAASGGDTAGTRGTDGGADGDDEGARRSDPDAAQ